MPNADQDSQERIEQYRQEFRQRLAEGRERKLQIPLLVAVLGPGEGHEWYYKRQEIKERLEEDLHCTCILPEDEIQELGEPYEGSARDEEEDIFRECELLIAVDLSAGVMAEIEDFAPDPGLCQKMLILVPEEFRSGYQASGTLRQTSAEIQWFSWEQVKDCETTSASADRAWREKQKKRAGARIIDRAEQLRRRYHY